FRIGGGEQPLLHALRCLGYELAKQMRREIETPADILGKSLVRTGAGDKICEPRFGEGGALIGDDTIGDLSIAALDQNICQGRRKAGATADREQMRLAFRARNLD